MKRIRDGNPNEANTRLAYVEQSLHLDEYMEIHYVHHF